MGYHWNWGIFFEQIKSGDETYLSWILTGLGWTVAVSLCAWIIALALGFVAGTVRTTPRRWAVRLANAYVELFRNIPLLVQMFLWFFVVPEFLPRNLSLWVKQDMPAKEFITATVCLGLFTSARIAEQSWTPFMSGRENSVMMRSALIRRWRSRISSEVPA